MRNIISLANGPYTIQENRRPKSTPTKDATQAPLTAENIQLRKVLTLDCSHYAAFLGFFLSENYSLNLLGPQRCS